MRFDIVAKFDVIVIGSGISGLLCALELSKHKKSVCIVTKEAVTESSSLYAQGGIAVPLSESDSIEKHLLDTLKTGAGLCDIDVAKEIISNSRIALEKLISYGVKFDLNSDNSIQQTKEAAHSVPRVCHIGGDASGRYITKTLIDRASREPNISISQGSIVLSILSDGEGLPCGVLVEDVTHSKYVILAKDIIVATGGLGQLYKETTNPLVCTGDGVAMVYRIGGELQDVEMIQFHPTVLLGHGDPLLITEAIRGEGARLKNVTSEYFANKYHELGELAPRDVLARAILNELDKTKSKYVYLDLSNFKPEYFETRFPTVYKSCIERKVDLFKHGIPVAPAAHYFIGGIKCDISGKTSIPCLWAVGEVASNGFHGANRLASNSLLECIVIPHILVKNLLSKSKQSLKINASDYLLIDTDSKDYTDVEIDTLVNELKSRNSKNLGLIRQEDDLNEHLEWLNSLLSRININVLNLNYQAQELKNMLLLSSIICQGALNRKHSLGVHYRSDFPNPGSEIKHSVFCQNKQFSQVLTFLK